MSRYLLLFVTCLCVACQAEPEPKLQTGRWTGTLTPMNHPDISNPINYVVDYREDSLILSIMGPNGVLVPTQDEHIESDTLFFRFKEPEQQELLKCALAKKDSGEFAGKCIDTSGKWARFTMIPPNK